MADDPTMNTSLLNNEQSNIQHMEQSLSLTEKIKACWQDQAYRKFTYMLCWLIICAYFAGVTGAFADNRAIQIYSTSPPEPLGDIGIAFVHLFIKGEDINDVSDGICVYTILIALFVCVLTLRLTGFKTQRECVIILTEFGIFLCVLFSLRDLHIWLTTFPTPSHQVVWQECTAWKNVWSAPFIMITGIRSACHDFFFSGHTIVVTICALMISKYSMALNEANAWWRVTTFHWRILRYILVFLLWFDVFMTVFCLLVLELHYSIDITIAFTLTIIIWKIYEAQIQYRYGFFAWWITEDKVNQQYESLY